MCPKFSLYASGISLYVSAYNSSSGAQLSRSSQCTRCLLGEDGFCLPLSLRHRSFVRTHKEERGLEPCEIQEVLSKFVKNNGRNAKVAAIKTS
jgi:hypothetical protein